MIPDPRSAGSRLAAWYRENARDLPWRRTRDPYAVWVSETMLQQTTVATVFSRWETFLERFPDVGALARADLADVLGVVQGLGYYRRFRFLKRASEKLAAETGGRLPGDAAGWRSLPGVGAYMAGAIASIAFDQPEPAVDGNVCRVLARYLEKPGDLLRPQARKEIEGYIRRMMTAAPPNQVTQALFDLGAGICVPREPACLICPLRGDCRALAHGTIDRYPEKKVRAAMQDVVVASAAIERDGKFLLVKRAADARLMPDFWETPAVWAADEAAATTALAAEIVRLFGTAGTIGPAIAEARHTITKHRLRCLFFATTIGRSVSRSDTDRAWVAPSPKAVAPGALTSITRKLFRALEAKRPMSVSPRARKNRRI